MPTVPTLFITGPPGAGKTTIGAQIGTLLHDPPIPHAFIDVDALSWGFPPPPDDRFNQRLAFRNLRDVWRNFATAGATHLILARVLEDRSELDAYQRAIPGAAIIVVRLVASIATLEARLLHRYDGVGASRDASWHLDRAAELAPIMDKASVEDVLISTEGRSPEDIAEEILGLVGWSA